MIHEILHGRDIMSYFMDVMAECFDPIESMILLKFIRLALRNNMNGRISEEDLQTIKRDCMMSDDDFKGTISSLICRGYIHQIILGSHTMYVVDTVAFADFDTADLMVYMNVNGQIDEYRTIYDPMGFGKLPQATVYNPKKVCN